MAAETVLMTVEEFAALPPTDNFTELVRGVVIEMPPPSFRHGEVCSNVSWVLNSFVRPAGIGRVITNDAGVVTERDPDTVRGPDLVFISNECLPSIS